MENKQKSPEWFNARKGRFTASRINELLGIKGFGLTGEGYISEKANEIAFGLDTEDSFVSFDMQRGLDLEPIAFAKFKELKALEFLEVKESYFFPFGESAGASPDGLVGEDAILEIKCPKAKKFFNLVRAGIAGIDKIYIDQMQMQMLCSNSIRCHFFNYIIFNGVEMHHEIIVERDDARIELITTRIAEAIIIRDEFINILITNKQF